MDFEILSGAIEGLETELLVVGIEAGGVLTPAARNLDTASGGYLSDIVGSGDIRGAVAESLLLHHVPGVRARRVLLLGLGQDCERNDRNYRKQVRAAFDAIRKIRARDVLFALDVPCIAATDMYRQSRLLIEWGCAELYRYDQTKSGKAEPQALAQVRILLPENAAEAGRQALADGAAIANGVALARDLGNLPGNVCTPSYLAEQAVRLAQECDRVSTSVLDERDMAALGMGSLLAVGNGSDQPSKLIVIQYNGSDDPDAQPHVLVGKGITFDTGGISLKPGAAMDEMKFDMCGAASVLGTLNAVAEMALPINVVGIVAAAENMPGSRALKPGDVVTTLSGQTVEVLNTDAEGRLVLCDALTYAGRFKPKTVVDIATLTGACSIALGSHACGLLANDDALAGDLLSAGSFAADRAWRLPLWDEYQEQLDSNFADIANLGGPAAGTITAACFLSRFAGAFRWAHLDIAGVARNSGKEKGATGRCVPLLSQYLLEQAATRFDGAPRDDASAVTI
ncbi:cytosol aminopeptidase [Marinobacterium nitratireducens]|uniref:Probable cytosol aminopeptidase n=1 Tax=Marinobacterium nitratireducens TaxID=518897 RepID=A0A918DTJ9_9GAMM|nr:leucyl aminopeptidase [Marinobacterium nitratireducens]GGO81720.1 cytosol aminopeptidase [Marinobacterium nitratireducens]